MPKISDIERLTPTSLRDKFILPADGIYLNCANMSPLLKSVRAAGEVALGRRAAPWSITANDWFNDAELLRQLAARVFHSTENDIAFVPSVSYGLAVAAKNLKFSKKGNIVILENQYPSNYYVWHELARTHGLEMKTALRSTASSLTECLLATIDEQTRLVAIPNVHWMDGALVNLIQVRQRAKDVGAYFVLDLSQSLCALPISMKDVDPDFAVSVGYKWQVGPYGLAYLYVAPRHQGGEPLEYSWLTRRGAEDFTKLTEYTNEYKEGARRFDMGEFSQFHLLPMAIAAMRHILECGVEEINSTLTKLTARISDFKASANLTLPGYPSGGHIVGLPLEKLNAGRIKSNLQKENIIVSFRGTSIRVSPYLYNTLEEINAFLSCIER
jgi:selenocysteine lyase/cysteine desulfurase